MNKTFTTAKGIAYYPYISAPDTKFDEQGHYKVNLCLSGLIFVSSRVANFKFSDT